MNQTPLRSPQCEGEGDLVFEVGQVAGRARRGGEAIRFGPTTRNRVQALTLTIFLPRLVSS